MTHADASSAHTPMRILGLTWLGVSLPVLLVASLLALISDHPDDRTAGVVLGVLAVAGLAVGAWILVAAPGAPGRARNASFALSAVWLVGAALVYPTQEFAVDALWVAGVPALGALVCAAVTWSTARRPAGRTA